jgi:hypothetical protein
MQPAPQGINRWIEPVIAADPIISVTVHRALHFGLGSHAAEDHAHEGLQIVRYAVIEPVALWAVAVAVYTDTNFFRGRRLSFRLCVSTVVAANLGWCVICVIARWGSIARGAA